MVKQRSKAATAFVTRGELAEALAPLATKDDVRAIAVSVENLESHIRHLAGGIRNMGESFERKLTEVEARLSTRLDVLERVVRQNSADIQKNSMDIQKNSADVQKMSAEIAAMRTQLERREGKLDQLERRIEIVEERLGIR